MVKSGPSIEGNHIEGGGACAGAVTASAPSGDGLSVTLVDDNNGSTANVTFRWLDPGRGIGE